MPEIETFNEAVCAMNKSALKFIGGLTLIR